MAGPGGFGRGNADNQGQCLGPKREWDRDRGSSLSLSNSPLEGGREEAPRRGITLGREKEVGSHKWASSSTEQTEAQRREGTGPRTHSLQEAGKGAQQEASLPTRGCDAWWTPHSLALFPEGQ